MGLVERVVLRLLHVVPERVRRHGRDAVLRAALEELALEGRHQRVDLLADRLAEVVRLGRREAGEVLGDLHVLLLVDADAVRVRCERLQALVEVGDRLLLLLAARVDRDVRHRARPVERDERDQVLELGRLHLPQRLAHPGRLELEHAGRIALREHLVDLLVVERKRRPVGPVADELARLLQHVEVAQTEEVDLQETKRLDVAHRELRHDLLVGALLLQGDDLHQRLRSDHDAGGVDRVLARQPFERLREVDDLARDGIRVVLLLQRLARFEASVERLARPFRDQLRDLVHDAVWDLQHPTRVAHRRARGHRSERDDLGDAIAAVLLGDVVDDAVASVDGEVDVRVGERLATRVEEPLEQEVVLDRIEVGDLEAVRDEAARR